MKALVKIKKLLIVILGELALIFIFISNAHGTKHLGQNLVLFDVLLTQHYFEKSNLYLNAYRLKCNLEDAENVTRDQYIYSQNALLLYSAPEIRDLTIQSVFFDPGECSQFKDYTLVSEEQKEIFNYEMVSEAKINQRNIYEFIQINKDNLTSENILDSLLNEIVSESERYYELAKTIGVYSNKYEPKDYMHDLTDIKEGIEENLKLSIEECTDELVSYSSSFRERAYFPFHNCYREKFREKSLFFKKQYSKKYLMGESIYYFLKGQNINFSDYLGALNSKFSESFILMQKTDKALVDFLESVVLQPNYIPIDENLLYLRNDTITVALERINSGDFDNGSLRPLIASYIKNFRNEILNLDKKNNNYGLIDDFIIQRENLSSQAYARNLKKLVKTKNYLQKIYGAFDLVGIISGSIMTSIACVAPAPGGFIIQAVFLRHACVSLGGFMFSALSIHKTSTKENQIKTSVYSSYSGDHIFYTYEEIESAMQGTDLEIFFSIFDFL